MNFSQVLPIIIASSWAQEFFFVGAGAMKYALVFFLLSRPTSKRALLELEMWWHRENSRGLLRGGGGRGGGGGIHGGAWEAMRRGMGDGERRGAGGGRGREGGGNHSIVRCPMCRAITSRGDAVEGVKGVEQGQTCCICLEEEATVCLSCGHLCLCGGCVDQLEARSGVGRGMERPERLSERDARELSRMQRAFGGDAPEEQADLARAMMRSLDGIGGFGFEDDEEDDMSNEGEFENEDDY